MRRAVILLGLALLSGGATAARGHCQIPCGIFDDPARFVLMREHVTTIEKSMQEIKRLGATESPDWNQLVRWVDNKEHHADELSQIATYYFLAQRIAPASEQDETAWARYVKELTLVHGIVRSAMKAKQTVELEHVAALRSQIDQLEAVYLGQEK